MITPANNGGRLTDTTTPVVIGRGATDAKIANTVKKTHSWRSVRGPAPGSPRGCGSNAKRLTRTASPTIVTTVMYQRAALPEVIRLHCMGTGWFELMRRQPPG